DVSATSLLYTLSLHDALPICGDAADLHAGPAGYSACDGFWRAQRFCFDLSPKGTAGALRAARTRRALAALSHDCFLVPVARAGRSEEHTSELQSLRHLVCRLL